MTSPPKPHQDQESENQGTPSASIEEYLETIFRLLETSHEKYAKTGELARLLKVAPASVTQMMQKLAARKYLIYHKGQGVRLTQKGREIALDVNEGADMVMVKPALSYLDVIARIRPEIRVPLVAYNVSGEYAMVKAAESAGWLDGAAQNRAAMEICTSIKRAGADIIISYHALDLARQLNPLSIR